jgi:hypothetical protein
LRCDWHLRDRSIGRRIEVLTASSNGEIDAAFASLAPKRIDALVYFARYTVHQPPLPARDTRHAQSCARELLVARISRSIERLNAHLGSCLLAIFDS